LVKKTAGTPCEQSTAIHAASILCGFLASTPTQLPRPHVELLKQAREDHNLCQRLIFAAALTPWKNMTYTEKKRSLPLIEGIIREGLKVGQSSIVLYDLMSMHLSDWWTKSLYSWRP
jgi:tRNA nucleotidyltransferase (CCA-adding enzyme)